ncbi:MAG: hypothetical protein RI897_2471 [Verrucomicrobiota bacterium]|jgi:arylsulfatase A-like enzyme
MTAPFRIQALLAALILTATPQVPAATPPNILVILTDDQGRGDYSAFGTPDIQTPGIDRIFREGMDLTNFRANCPVCSPTRAALLTGRYPDRVGVPGVIRTHPEDSWGYLAPQAILLPALLKKNGYHTALVGKWHLGLTPENTPNTRGFDHFHGFLGDMMDDYWNHRRHGINYMRLNQQVIDPQGHATDLFTQWAVTYLRERQSHSQPWFLYLAYNAPHSPIQPKDDWLAKVTQRQPEMQPARAKLVALIEHMDAGIAKVLQTLDETDMARNTLVFFTSDNGGVNGLGANNGPWKSGKQHVYEGGLRVPAAVRWPDHIQPGSNSDLQLLTMDIFATACQAAQTQTPNPIEGISFLPALLGQPQRLPDRPLYFVRREGNANYGGKTIEALINGPWKILQDSPWQPLELYNLESDPEETNNLRDTNPDVFSQMSASLRRMVQYGGQTPWQPAH